MDNITITIADPGLDWLALYICLGIAGLALAVAIFLPKIVRLSTPDWDSDDTESLWLLSCVAIIISVVVGVGCVVTAYGDEVEEFKVEALEGVGLSNISFDDDKVVASVDGEYFAGALIETSDREWLLVDLQK